MALHAILIAGGRLPRDLQPLASSPVKALLTVGGETLLARAARAAGECQIIERICAVGNAEVAQAAQALCLEYAPEGESVIDNVLNAFTALGGREHSYLIISPDLPFITVQALARFLRAVQSAHAEIALATATGAAFLERFPGAPNRFERIDGGPLTLGSVFYLTGLALQSNIPLARDFFRWRKWPHRLALLLGLPIAWGYLTGTLKLAQLEARAARLTGVEVRGLSAPPELAYDVDTLANLRFAEGLLGEG
jgi:molybdopterin-guanine dinucleotide biosynthesis protein A